MIDQTKEPVSLDLQSVAIFAPVNARPVAILNEASSAHSRLIYCERVIANLSMIADVCTNHDELSVQYLAGVFANQLEPLSTLLRSMAEDAEATGRGAA